MQEGSFRCDANVSVRRPGGELGTRREIKNLNSFRFLEQAINYEVQWQIDTLVNGGTVHQATVLFDPDSGETRMMRSKEDAHDYRYFPDPDLLPLEISEEWKEQVRATLPELPHSKQVRYVNELGLSAYDASIITASREMADFFETALNPSPALPLSGEGATAISSPDKGGPGGGEAKLCANWLIGEVSAQLNRDGLEMAKCPITPLQLGGMLKRIADGTISNAGAKEVFRTMWSEGGDADSVIESKGLKQVSDAGALEKIVDEIMAANPAQVAEYRSGTEKVFGFFVGLAMKASKGKANPAQMNEILKKKLAA
jgi:aspartyl-tRNA(Asn)/glutamyl-tRNA(Gln) amidotransferase subunit B